MLDKRKFYINGQWVDPIIPKDLEVINPSNEETFAVISLGDISDTNLAVEAAKKSFISWSKTSKEKKLTLLENLYEVYKSRWNEMAEAISLEMGAPIDWSTEEQSSSGADHIKSFIRATNKSIQYINDHPDDIRDFYINKIQFILDKFSLEQQKIINQNISDISIPSWEPWQEYPEDTFNEIYSWMSQRNLISPSINYSDIVNSSIFS